MSNGVTLFTDGACSGNPGPGGWGAILSYKGQEKELFGSDAETTNNRMELMAVIEGLRALNRPVDVTIYTDSKYVLEGATKWMAGWKAKGWNKKGGLKNADLWQLLDLELAKHSVTWQWVKGHSGHPGNERADALAVKGAEQAKTKVK
ncbi:MAG: ribonuclease HI [Magnetococcales bacterium]|nr:ribonuclease HI [Magnetococcales bacterium]|tara:strand:- start:47879 stop:48322 length:444 start_codon:yes stop_codon:yes gene_type:complete